MNSSINQVDSSVYGFGIPFPQFMPYQMAHQHFPTICNGIYAHMPIYVAPNMNQGIQYNGMNYPSNIQPTMVYPMQYPYPSPVMSPHCSPNGLISLNANSYPMVPTFENGCGIWPSLFTLPARVQEAQPMTPISPYDSSMNNGENYQPLASATQFHTVLPMETTIPPARRHIPIQKANKRKLDENEAATPIKKLKNGFNVVSLHDDEVVLPPLMRDSNRRTQANTGIMPMPPRAPGTLFAGSMACNRHPDDISALCSAVHTRRATFNFNPLLQRSSPKVQQPSIPGSIRKRMDRVSKHQSLTMGGHRQLHKRFEKIIYMLVLHLSTKVAVIGERNRPSPIRNPACFLPRSLVLPGSSDEQIQDELFAPEEASEQNLAALFNNAHRVRNLLLEYPTLQFENTLTQLLIIIQTVTLLIRSNLVKKIDNLYTLTALKELDLHDNQLKVIENLDTLYNMEILDLSCNKIVKIENVDKLKNLKVLKLGCNKIKNIGGLDKLENLEHLELGSNRIITIENLQNNTNLQRLFLNSNKIKSIENNCQLKLLKNLVELNISSNLISNIEGLTELPQLKMIFLAHNFIQKIEGFEKSENLEYMNVDYNQIEEINNIGHLKALTDFSAKYNKVRAAVPQNKLKRNYVPQRELTALELLNTVYLIGNPISLHWNYRNKVTKPVSTPLIE